ncbi:TPA: hypothetical protein DEW47_01685 [Patescibacteria group bacterium]|nr:MAG: hypothetical protein UT71_C0009G0012 [Parcubacteria group bacterium GW2011_GWF2_40_10]KKR47443.1 MAG: hypothetical protein UT83_C0009G0009 [Parcubacteria group bacterium GW2011_GWA2_40_143]KKR59864.1 MAG: hypothetical protein UT97_C0009G0009 [Parcubacteria group bacterium GW2011_GWC2_40_31]KKR74935.1 MAG: hypothetical protein UU18_C0016G0011 [Parcubacteria group bacterium GW2011_GWB2_40_8]KKR76341.1 MAG: hypothetical protein UU20_C0027G0013 [Parcubacteria group bacterium GW2011_GWE2_40_
MINLLPDENKIFFKKEYIKRLLLVASLFFIFAIIVSVLMIMPTYWFSYSIKKNLDNQIAFSETTLDKLDIRGITADIGELKNKLKILEGRKESAQLNVNLKRVLESRLSGVKVERIEYKRDTQSKKDEISLWGVARSRENLMGYVDMLEQEFGKENVVSPISNLLSKADTSFVLSVSIDYEK